jgi:hypothetical protein
VPSERVLAPEAIRVLPPADEAAPALEAERVALPLQVCQQLAEDEATACAPLTGLRVQLASALDGRLLAEASTDAEGAATLVAAALPGQALRLRIPALGLDIAAAPTTQPVEIVVAAYALLEAAP